MSHAVQTHIALFKIIIRANKTLQQKIFKIVDEDFVEVISECIHNFLKGNIKISKNQVKKLKKHQASLRTIGDPTISATAKKKIINQKGHLFIRLFLINTIEPLMGFL
jgi:flagellar motor switch protein FliM